jgi:radical S-adenosyl methionine domain-containing protein 2
MKNNHFFPSVNFHVWESCNMRCKFCFATFQDIKQSILPTGHLSEEKAIRIVQELANFGFQKITFAGGEPTLCPWLPELIKTAKQAGMTTMIVTNGSRMDNAFLETNKSFLDWIAISIDSLNSETNQVIGRTIAGKKPLTLDHYKSIIEHVKNYGYGLKINTVVNSKNFNEDITAFIRFANPRRWKIFQVLPISGQNDNSIDDFKISVSDFYRFVSKHQELADITDMVSETNTQIVGSYAMVDPAGRFFDNIMGCHRYSQPILEVGVTEALKGVEYDFKKFTSRGGIYDWNLQKILFS